MRRLVVSNLMSLDGYVSGPNGELEWFVYEGFVDDTEWGDFARKVIQSAGGILMGHQTYREFVSYWPRAPDSVIAEKMNSLPKVVFSKTLDKVAWGKYDTVRLVKTDAAAEVRRLKKQKGKDLVIYGSATLVSSLMKEGLVDEFQIFVQPVVLGRGKPEFIWNSLGVDGWYWLKLVDVIRFKTGAVGLIYHPAKKNPAGPRKA